MIKLGAATRGINMENLVNYSMTSQIVYPLSDGSVGRQRAENRCKAASDGS